MKHIDATDKMYYEKMHNDLLTEIVKGYIPSYSKLWVQIAIMNKRYSDCEILLERMGCPKDMTLKEKLCWYYLMNNEDD